MAFSDFPEHGSYRHMMDRCYNPKNNTYRLYGARGITVCDRWKESFYNFLEDMGTRTEGYSIERVNNHLGYSLENCVWADLITQNNNTRRNNYIEYDGRIQTVAQWSRELNIPVGRIYTNLKNGWSFQDVVDGSYKTKKRERTEKDILNALVERVARVYDIGRGEIKTKLKEDMNYDFSNYPKKIKNKLYNTGFCKYGHKKESYGCKVCKVIARHKDMEGYKEYRRLYKLKKIK